jgi:HlyD family secretion protein
VAKSVTRYWPIVLGVIAVGAIAYSCMPAAVEVDVAEVTRGLLRVTVDHEGKTRIKEKYVVSAPLSGRLARIDIHPGDRVLAAKTILTTIEPTDPALLDVRARVEAEARVRAMEANLQRANATVARDQEIYLLAKADVDRVRKLLPTGAISKEDADRIEFRYRVVAEEMRASQFGVTVAEFELEQARAALLRTQPRDAGNSEPARFDITSPISGAVLRVFQESATIVTPGTRLVEVGDPSDLECEIDVLSVDAARIVPGAKVILEHWGGREPLIGTVRVVEPAAFTKISALGVEEQRVWVIVDFIDGPEKRKSLGDGYRVEARIVVWEKENVIKVPAGALFRRGEEWAVYVAKDGRAQLRTLKVGESSGIETEALSGIDAGETVILHPSDRVRAGVRIAARVSGD